MILRVTDSRILLANSKSHVAVAVPYFIFYFIRSNTGILSIFDRDGGGSCYTGMFGYLTAFQEMIQQVQVICMEWVM